MCFFLGTHCGGRRCALPPAPPTRFYVLTGSSCYLLLRHMHRLFGFILSHCGGRRLHPPTRFDVLIGSGCSLLSLFFPVHVIFIDIHTHFYVLTGSGCSLLSLLFPVHVILLSPLTSVLHMHRLFGFILSHCGGRRLHPSTRFHVLTGSGCSLLSLLFPVHVILLSPLTSVLHMHCLFGFILSHCGGRRCALPPAPPHPLLFFNRLLWLPTLTLFFWFILSLLVSIETCAYVVLSWYALRGEALRPPPCTPPPAFMF